MRIKVDYAAFVGVMTAKAKKDVRYYFEGIFIDPRGYLVATDGRRLFCASVAEGAGPYIIRVIGKPTAKFHHAVFDTDDLCVRFFREDEREYFGAVESIMRAHDGRPHWGKMHRRTADDLRPAYPRFDEFVAVRDRLDPDRLFANEYLTRVLGE